MKLFFTMAAIAFHICAFSQSYGILSGSVTDKTTSRPVYGASISIVEKSTIGSTSDSTGKFTVRAIPAGSYTVRISAVGYRADIRYNIVITSGNDNTIEAELEPSAVLGEVTVTASRSAGAATLSTPLSVQRLSTEEIKSNPGGNFDISRVIQSLPGVSGTDGSTGGFRNDIIIRGGAPGESVFYLDGIEIPVINHFSTQGSGGGPTGILNVSFIQDVKLSTSAFDARYDNALSSVFQFVQKTGNPNRLQGNARLSGSELAATFEGPLSGSGKTTFLASARRSYLQFLFSLLDIPVRPNYWDFQTKITHKINNKTSLNIIGIGAIDEFQFGKVRDASPEKLYSLANSPSINQYNYTGGISLKSQLNKGYMNLALSRNVLNNTIEKYDDNKNNDPGKKRLDIRSQEAENKLRLDFNFADNGWQWSYGAAVQYEQFSNDYYNRYRTALYNAAGDLVQPALIFNSDAQLEFWRYGIFAQAGKRVFNNRLGISAGIRSDLNSFTADGTSAGRTLSPRIALSYSLTDKWNLNASVGSYYKLPAYTILGYQDNTGVFVNKNAENIRADHYVTGLEFIPFNSLRFTLEGFYKRYNNYPVSVRDGISLANQGGDFNVVGNEAISSTGKGRAYGIEFFAQQKLTNRLFGVLSYTFFKSEFTGIDNKYAASAWDNRHLLSLTAGYKFPRNYELGLKFRYQGAAPYTPFDETSSRLNYLSTGSGVLDYTQVNTLRLSAFNQADIRIDKRWNYRKITFDAFIDLTNFLLFKSPAYPKYTFQRDENNTTFITSDGQALQANGSNAIPVLLKNDDAQVTPTIGFILEF